MTKRPYTFTIFCIGLYSTQLGCAGLYQKAACGSFSVSDTVVQRRASRHGNCEQKRKTWKTCFLPYVPAPSSSLLQALSRHNSLAFLQRVTLFFCLSGVEPAVSTSQDNVPLKHEPSSLHIYSCLCQEVNDSSQLCSVNMGFLHREMDEITVSILDVNNRP